MTKFNIRFKFRVFAILLIVTNIITTTNGNIYNNDKKIFSNFQILTTKKTNENLINEISLKGGSAVGSKSSVGGGKSSVGRSRNGGNGKNEISKSRRANNKISSSNKEIINRDYNKQYRYIPSIYRRNYIPTPIPMSIHSWTWNNGAINNDPFSNYIYRYNNTNKDRKKVENIW